MAVKEEIGHEEVVTGPKIDIFQSDGGVRAKLRFVDAGENAKSKNVPFSVPVFEVTWFDIGEYLEGLCNLGTVVSSQCQRSYGFKMKARVF